MRLKHVSVTADLIAQMVTRGNVIAKSKILEGVPAGAKLVGVGIVPSGGPTGHSVAPSFVQLIFEHESFEDVDQSEMPPSTDVIVQTVSE